MNGFDIKHKATLLLTRKCNARCGHCGLDSSPSANEVFPCSLIPVIVNSLSDLGYRRLSITGGEPTLFYNKLYRLCSLARNNNIDVSFITNGWWGNNPVAIDALFETLDSQTCSVAVSIDDYHSSYIPVQQSFSAIRTILEIKKHCDIISIHNGIDRTIQDLFYYLAQHYGAPSRIEKDFNDDCTKPDYLNLYFHDRSLKVRYSGVGPVGRASGMPIDRKGPEAYDMLSGGCTTELSLTCDGTVKPCCTALSPGFEHLSMGNIGQESLQQIFDRNTGLKKQKPCHAVRNYYLKKIKPVLPPLANICELCFITKKFSNKHGALTSLKDVYNELETTK